MEGGAHEIKSAVRRDEADGAVVLEARQTHALVELHVLEINRLVFPSSPLALEQHLSTPTSTLLAFGNHHDLLADDTGVMLTMLPRWCSLLEPSRVASTVILSLTCRGRQRANSTRIYEFDDLAQVIQVVSN